MTYSPSRWAFEAEVDPNDKPRLRSFINNEIAYYNGILAGFAPWLRTSPALFDELNENLLGEMAALGVTISSLTADALPKALEPYRDTLFDAAGKSVLDERMRLMMGSLSNSVVLHPATRRAMVVEMIQTHRVQAAALMRTNASGERSVPVSLLQPHDGRVKRHVQLVNKAVVVDGGRNVRTAYNAVPIRLSGTLPADAKWNVMLIRSGENGDRNKWGVEFRNHDRGDYIIRQVDTPLGRDKERAPPASRGARRPSTGYTDRGRRS